MPDQLDRRRRASTASARRWAVSSVALELVARWSSPSCSAPCPAHFAARARAARRAAGRDRPLPGPPAAALAAGRAGAHRPRLGLARGADAPRPRRARHRPRRRRAGRQPRLAADDDPPRPGGLRWRAAVRRQRLVPRRPRRPLAGEPAGRRPASVFAARAWVLTEFLLVASFVTMVLAGLRAGLPNPSELTALLCTWVVVPSRSSPRRCAGRRGDRSPSTCAPRGPPRRRRW